jgi:hypothetical protein
MYAAVLAIPRSFQNPGRGAVKRRWSSAGATPARALADAGLSLLEGMGADFHSKS